MATQIWPVDTETLAVNAFKDEGAFLFNAGQTADALSQRVLHTHPNVKRFTVSRAELTEYAYLLSRAVAIGSEYHLDAADTAA